MGKYPFMYARLSILDIKEREIVSASTKLFTDMHNIMRYGKHLPVYVHVLEDTTSAGTYGTLKHYNFFPQCNLETTVNTAV